MIGHIYGLMTTLTGICMCVAGGDLSYAASVMGIPATVGMWVVSELED